MRKNDMKKLLVLLFLSVAAVDLSAQQTPLFSQYMYNGLAINPAYAGSKDYLSLTAVYRKQWVDFPGAPQTQTFTAHGPLSQGKMGLGFLFMNDKTGEANKRMDFIAAYAFHIQTGSGTLSLGIQGGVIQFSNDMTKLRTFDLGDNIAGMNESEISPTAGAGLYYYTDKFYFGASAPQLLTNDPKVAPKLDQHFFVTSGIVLGSSDNFKLKPSFLLRLAPPAPLSYDINLNAFFGRMLGIGVSYRAEDAIVGLLELQITPQLRFGYSYDMIQSDIKNYASGSHEFMLGYDFGHEVPKVRVPRYF
jgi:type IX secretion system PorP/SprF family membrane protein